MIASRTLEWRDSPLKVSFFHPMVEGDDVRCEFLIQGLEKDVAGCAIATTWT